MHGNFERNYKMVAEMTFPQLERTINPTHDIKLFAGRSNTKLAQEIADYLGTSIGPMVIKNFADGEFMFRLKKVSEVTMYLLFNLCATPLTKILLNY